MSTPGVNRVSVPSKVARARRTVAISSGPDGQLKAGSQAEQVGKHLRSRRGTAREVARQELAQGSLKLLFVDLVLKDG